MRNRNIDLEKWMTLPDETNLTVEQVAVILRCSENTVRSEIYDGALAAFQLRGCYRISKGAVVEYIAKNSMNHRTVPQLSADRTAAAAINAGHQHASRARARTRDVSSRKSDGRNARSSGAGFGQEYPR